MPFTIETTTKDDDGKLELEVTTRPTRKQADAYAYENCQWESTIKAVVKDNRGEQVNEFRGFYA